MKTIGTGAFCSVKLLEYIDHVAAIISTGTTYSYYWSFYETWVRLTQWVCFLGNKSFYKRIIHQDAFPPIRVRES